MTQNKKIWYTDGAIFTEGETPEDDNVVVTQVMNSGMNGHHTEEGREWAERIVKCVNAWSHLSMDEIDMAVNLTEHLLKFKVDSSNKEEKEV